MSTKQEDELSYLITVSYHNHSHHIEYNKHENEMETLRYLILSLHDQLNEFIIVDYTGKLIETLDDLEAISYLKDSLDDSSITMKACHVWVLDSPYIHIHEYCWSRIFNNTAIIQPSFRFIDTNFCICSCCKQYFDPELLVPTPVELNKYVCNVEDAFDFGLALPKYALKEIKIKCDIDSPGGKYVVRKLLDEVVSLQPIYRNVLQPSREERELENRLSSGVTTVTAYEDPQSQAAARSVVDYAKVKEYAERYRHEDDADDAAFVRGLLKWFKKEFFRWCNRPRCTSSDCGATGKSIDALGTGPSSEEEQRVGWAQRTEFYRCSKCHTSIRFPRINNPRILLETRRGRCGEWANCFCLICRALGLDVRWVLDFTDHVWAEVWVQSLGRYVHADPCETTFDAPLMYESGWNKKLSYVFSFSRYGVVDSTPRYTRKWITELYARRSHGTEKLVRESVKRLDEQTVALYMRRLAVSGGVCSELTDHLRRLELGAEGFVHRGDISMAAVQQRKKADERELAMVLLMTPKELTDAEKQGRISGDREWRKQRGEIGTSGTIPSTTDLSLKVPWFVPGQALPLSHTAAGDSVDIFVASVSMDDKVDNTRNGGTSTLHHLYARHGLVGSDGGVFSESCVSVGGVGVCAASRGHNVVVVCGHTGALLASRAFDTWGSSTAGDELVEYLRSYIPEAAGDTPSTDTVSTSSIFMRRIISVTVLDSGEHGGEKLKTLFMSLLSNSDLYASASPLPGHRESWLMVAVVDGQVGCPCTRIVYHASSPAGHGPTSVGLSLPLISTDASHADEVSFVELTNRTISNAASIVVNSSEANMEEFKMRLMERCHLCSQYVGFAVSTNGNIGYLLGQEAFPLKQDLDEALRIYLKGYVHKDVPTVKSVVSESVEVPISRCVRYIPIGGEHHEDTIAFDSTQYLWDMCMCIMHNCSDAGTMENILSRLKFEEVTFYGGDLIHGLQCHYSVQLDIGPIHFMLPLILHWGENEETLASRTMRICETGDRVTNISAKYGALIDSVSIHYTSTKSKTAGGAGGGLSNSVCIPEGWELVGFYGGVGGHVHHLGVVVYQRYQCATYIIGSSKAPRDGVFSLYRLLDICSKHNIWACGMICTDDQDKSSRNYRCSNIGKFLDYILSLLHGSDSIQDAIDCIFTVIKYNKNIMKDCHNEKYRRINISNSNFQRHILENPYGLQLLTSGPAFWKISPNCSHMESFGFMFVCSIDNENDCTTVSTLWLKWLSTYVGFLEDVLHDATSLMPP